MKKIFLSMVCLFVVIAMISCGSSSMKQLTDQEILVKIYDALNGPNWSGSQGDNWLSEKPIGEWKGVEINDEGRVIALRVVGDSVSGLIPAEIGGLTELEQLVLYSRNFDIPNVIPTEIGKLTKLKILSLTAYTSSEHESPVLPDISALVNLERLLLTRFGGTIPENIGQLNKLRILTFSGFEGKIPESICKLTELEELFLSTSTQPEGEVPGCIGRLSKLKSLRIDYSTGFAGGINEVNAKFPESVWDLTNLEYLFIRSISNTGGPIFSDKVAKMTNLKNITIISCGLTGTIPVGFFASGKLTDLSIYRNNLTGSIPSEIGNCVNLSTLRLNQNQLTSTIPAELAKCEKLILFDLSGNQLSPNIPADLKAHPNFSKFKF